MKHNLLVLCLTCSVMSAIMTMALFPSSFSVSTSTATKRKHDISDSQFVSAVIRSALSMGMVSHCKPLTSPILILIFSDSLRFIVPLSDASGYKFFLQSWFMTSDIVMVEDTWSYLD